MSHTVAAAVTGVLVLAGTVWVGGFVVIAVVARVAGRTLEPAARVAFFRGLGKAYGVVGTTALAVLLGAGAALVYGRPWDGRLTATAVVATGVVVSLAAGVVQARRMSALRRRSLAAPGDAALATAVRRGAVRAGLLRSVIGGLSLALLALAVLLGS